MLGVNRKKSVAPLHDPTSSKPITSSRSSTKGEKTIYSNKHVLTERQSHSSPMSVYQNYPNAPQSKRRSDKYGEANFDQHDPAPNSLRRFQFSNSQLNKSDRA